MRFGYTHLRNLTLTTGPSPPSSSCRSHDVVYELNVNPLMRLILFQHPHWPSAGWPFNLQTAGMALLPVASLVSPPSGLHDNPWVCDCRLYDLVQFQKFPTLSVAFIDTRLRCSAPESVSGVLFSDTELRRCQLPRIHTAVARVRSAVGNNVLLRCGTIGVPIPDLTWRRADGRLLNGTGEFWSVTFCTVVEFSLDCYVVM